MIYHTEEELIFELNEESFTSEIISSPNAKGDLFIPRSITYQSHEYIVTSIRKKSFINCAINSIQFAEDSEIHTFQNQLFSYSSLEKISIPASVKNLEEGCFKNALHLKYIKISPKNTKYGYIRTNCLIIGGKSDENIDHYDMIVFAHRSRRVVTIPSYIKHICSNAFSLCYSLEFLYFEEDSELESIGNNAFSSSEIKYIKIPDHCTSIGQCAFSYCDNLKSILFSNLSELKEFGKKIFVSSHISNLYITKNIERIDEEWCYGCTDLKSIIISPQNQNFVYLNDEFLLGKTDPKSDVFDMILFARRDILKAVIPSFIKRICKYAFDECLNLESIEFAENSNLESIGDFAFGQSNISSISLPSSVKQIGERIFSDCSNLKNVEFAENSILTSISQNLFIFSSVQSINIPESVEVLEEDWCSYTSELIEVKISPKNKNFINKNKMILGKSDPKSDTFDILLFACRDITTAKIPSSITRISSYAFHSCKNLESVEIYNDSNLISIGKKAFSASAIESLFIPKHVVQIESCAFDSCLFLQYIEFDKESELTKIQNDIITDSDIEFLSLPKSIKELEEGWCKNNFCLNNVIIPSDNPYFSYIDSDKKIIVGKSNENVDDFDVVIFACRDIKKAIIPSNIKRIASFGFSFCYSINSIKFSENSLLNSIGENAFEFTSFRGIIMPKYIKEISKNAFKKSDLEYIECLGDDLLIGISSFSDCKKLNIISFPNARRVFIAKNAFNSVSLDFCMFTHPCAKVI